ncbi:MAG: WhiB family transcriptional regulator [Acidimicrobiia bacterium]|nr:WhiB family transcriptional regulator [Acidimicrobiia bacterium]
MVGADLPDLIPPRPRWHADAACRGRGDWFDLAAPDAKAICGECPVKQACADDGIEEPAGVWGGMSERDRRKLRRGRVA